MLFYNSPHHLVVHRPETYNLQRSMTLDDYLQLQLLLQHEQEQRKQRDAWQQEQLRLQHAMANLKALKENYRRQRAMQIQQCIERYREQEARIQAQEDFYRQCLAAAIEQRRAEEVYERYQRSQKPQRRDSYEDYREQQLASVLKLLFNQTDNEDDNDEVMQDTQAKNEEEDQEVQTLWDYITREQSHEQEDEEMQDSNEEEDEEEQEEESESEQQEETSRSPPRLAALPSSSDHHPEAYTPLFSRNDARSKEAVPVRQQASATPPLQNHVLNLKDLLDQLVSHDEEPQQQQHQAGFGKPQPIFDANESGAQDSATAQQPPPNTMTNLARELKSQSLGSTQEQEKQQKREQPSQPPKQFSKDAPQSKHNTRIFDADEPAAQPSAITQPPPANTTAHMHKEASQPQSTKPLFDLDEAAAARSSTAQPPPEHTTQNVLGDQADDNLYAPQDIRTEAEPTPLKEKTPAFPQQEQGQAQRQEKPSSRLPGTVSIKLDGISKELKSIRSREDEVLQAPLDFKEKNDTLILPATTPNNRHFLGYEDEIMRVMLKLDTIESDGDEGIRNARRALVKEAEGMLERLDEHKQREWERARRPQPSGPNKKNRKRKHKQQHHYKQPILQVS
ncbi:hypothetical protein BCR43DRAFT_494071 [Syncephalastrum racemosum]|uniref:BAG domain-containing protein n=1 Tax=Syncephalastrum racemosum TaxID=13706 RepID=A0A1X2H7B6_SYNRA|nr:hypothetical protein BCR43DRAFT_494071 [Syncephalastrum racemosum]